MQKLVLNNGKFALKDYKGSSVEIFCAPLIVENANVKTVKIKLNYSGAYGMGEKFNAINQKGNKVVNKVYEKFCQQGDFTYCPAPFFFTNTGVGFYVDTDKITSFDFKESEILLSVPCEADIYYKVGTPKDIIKAYMQMHGKAILPPKWAFEPWISANHWNTQSETLKQVELLKKHNFPAGVLVLEAWSDEATFYIFNGAKYQPKQNGEPLNYEDFDFSESEHWQNPKEMIRTLHENGLHVVLWQIPVYKLQGDDEEKNLQNDFDRQDAIKRKLCVGTKSGEPYTIPQDKWFGGSYIPDFTNPETVKTWFNKRKYLLDIGVDGFKTDGGEFIYSEDAQFFDGTTGAEGVNRYARDYTAAYTDFIGESRVLFSRAGYTGQHTVACHWGGDQKSTNGELKSVFKAGLNASLSGIIMWGFDIAGFAGELPSADLYLRASMLSCFCPIMQWHSEPDGGQFALLMPGIEGNNERSPWNIAAAHNAPNLIEKVRFYHWLRINLLPYIYSSAHFSAQNNEPIMRPLIYDFYNNEVAIQNETQYMFGSALLIAPYLNESEYEREVYLPKGNWYGFFDGKLYSGGQSVTYKSESFMPVFIKERCAVLLNKCKDVQIGEAFDKANNSNALHLVLAGQNGSSTFYCDESSFSVAWQSGEVRLSDNAPNGLTYEIFK